MYLNRARLMLKFMKIKFVMCCISQIQISCIGGSYHYTAMFQIGKTRKYNIRKTYFALQMGKTKRVATNLEKPIFVQRVIVVQSCWVYSTIELNGKMLVIYTTGLMTIWRRDIHLWIQKCTLKYLLLNPCRNFFTILNPEH